MRRLTPILLALALTACADFTAPALPEALTPADADAVTMAPLPPQTAPQRTPEPEPELFPLSESVETNITDAAAREIIAEMAALADAYGLSISYISGDGAWRSSVNGGTLYPSASTIKAMYCQYLLSAGVSLEREVVFDVTLERTSSTGLFTADTFGQSFTVAELMSAAIKCSDNMAYRILFSEFGRWGYNAWVEKLGLGGLAFPTPYEFMDVCADDLSAGMLEILARSEADSTLVELMRASDRKLQIAAGTDFETASKYGYEGGTLGYHDTAIVYAPAPYVLTVMSHIWANAPGADRPFADAARLADKLNAAIYAKNAP